MKVLILHASAGAGHRVAAEALAQAFHARGAAAEVRDILDDTPVLFRRTYARGYLHLVRRAPELWGYMYARSNRTAQQPWERGLRLLFNRLNTLSFRKRFLRAGAGAVVCTHFLPLELVSAWASRVPLYGVVTDFDVHALWASRPVDGYFVASEEARRQLIRRGQPADTVRVTGIPVRAAFARPAAPLAMRRRYKLAPGRPTVLFLAGGFGVGPAEEFTQSLVRDAPDLQALVVVGRNERLCRRVERVAAGARRIRVFGHVDDIAGMMDAADLVVGKPGGLTCSEAMARGKPMLLVDPIPGQEQRNGEVLLERGAAARLADPADAAFKVQNLFEEPGRLARMAECARALGRPRAADEIATAVLEAGRPDPALRREGAAPPG